MVSLYGVTLRHLISRRVHHTHTHTHTVREFVPVGDGNTCRAPPRAVVCVRVDVRVCVGAFVFAVQPVATKCSCPSVFSIAAHEPIYIGG